MLAPAREKIALLGFSVLILIGMGFLVGYLAIGHSWNVAASNIDDAAGSMDGYITILYEGVVPLKEKPGAATTSPNASSNPSLPGSTVPKPGATATSPDASSDTAQPGNTATKPGEATASPDISSDPASTGSAAADASSDSAQPEDASPDASEARESEDALPPGTPPRATAPGTTAPGTTDPGATAPDAIAPGTTGPDAIAPGAIAAGSTDRMPSALQEEDEANEAPPEESLSLDGSSSAGNGTLVPQKPPLAIADVVQSYLDKRSSVLTLDTVHPETYREGVILKKGHKRFGVFCINAGDKQAKIDKQVAYFEAYQVDFIVAVVPDIELAKGTAGIDIVLSTQEEDLFIMGETKGTTFYVCAPTEGSVGAILISPSNVVSAKVLSEL